MTDSQIHRYCVDDMDKYIAGVSLYSKQMKQKVYQLSVELENERECANSIENLFVLLAGSLIEVSSLYRKFTRRQSNETWVHFNKNMIFDTMDYTWVQSYAKSHPGILASKHSAISAPVKSGLPIKAALTLGKKSQKIEESSKLRLFSKPDSSFLPQPLSLPSSSSSHGPGVVSGAINGAIPVQTIIQSLHGDLRAPPLA